jgi:hypothetical protein
MFSRNTELSGGTAGVADVGSSASLLRLDYWHFRVAQVVFVRKRLVEIQYFRTTITDQQREEFGRLVNDTIRRIESAQFLPHRGVRFPQNPCTSCPYVGLCLGRRELLDATLVRRPGDDVGLFDELTY